VPKRKKKKEKEKKRGGYRASETFHLSGGHEGKEEPPRGLFPTRPEGGKRKRKVEWAILLPSNAAIRGEWETQPCPRRGGKKPDRLGVRGSNFLPEGERGIPFS